MVAGPPKAARFLGVLQAMSLPPSPAPIATGWSDSCRAGFAPAEGRCLSTAHRKRPANGVLDARRGRLCGLDFRSGQVGGVEPGSAAGP